MNNDIQLQWEKTAPGVYKAVVGNVVRTLLDFIGTLPETGALKNMNDAAFPFDRDFIVALKDTRTTVCVPLSDDEQIFGFGLNYKTINQRGKALLLKTDHYAGTDTGRTHAPCPVYFTNKGYGVFFNTAEYVSAYCGSAGRKGPKSEAEARDRNTDKNWTSLPKAEYVEVSVPAGGMEIVVFAGDSVVDAVSRYNLYCGGGCLPPKWGLGFWYRFAARKSQSEIFTEMEEFAENGVHIDVVGLEPGWQSKAYPCSYEWSQERFPEPENFCRTLLNGNTRVNLWENPYISPEAGLYKDMYGVSSSHTVWCGLVPDYMTDRAVELLKAQHKNEHLAVGVSGYKIDECDGYDKWLWPDHAEFPSGSSAENMRQIYGLLLQKITTELFKEEDKRTYGLVRASNSGGSQYPYVIYNDKYDFNEYMTGLCNSSFSGVLWVPEVRKAVNASDWLRRFQLALFSPMLMLNSWASGEKPWSYPEVSDDIAELIKFRNALIPYFYNAFAAYRFRGIPPFRAFALDYAVSAKTTADMAAVLDDTENPYAEKKPSEINDQILIGDCLMAAFMRPDEKTRRIVLPEGNWYDYYTGKLAGRNTRITYEAVDNRLPLYVKEGGMIPLACGDGKTLEIRCYGSGGQSVLYDDDGESYGYEAGAYNEILLKFAYDGGVFTNSAEYIKMGAEKNYTDFKFILFK